MSIDYQVRSFPTFPISKQLFHVPGAMADGGFTSGGARISSPEPAGMSFLKIQPSLQVNEWSFPLSSWLMSMGNGEIFRVRLAPTPQIASARVYIDVPWGAQDIYPDAPWSNLQDWAGDLVAAYAAVALEGTNVVVIDMSTLGQLLQPGHVIGHQYSTYLVDQIDYDEDNIATVIIKTPLRKNVAVGDVVFFRPWFTGSIVNPGDFLATYDAEMIGNIELGMIVMSEVIIP